MATPYNHKETSKGINWEENPINVNDGKKPNTIVLICSLIHQGQDFM